MSETDVAQTEGLKWIGGVGWDGMGRMGDAIASKKLTHLRKHMHFGFVGKNSEFQKNNWIL